jgi:hypothetical protein
VGSFRFATQLASPAATDRLPGWGYRDVKSYFVVSSMERKTVQRRLKREEILSHRRFGGTCRHPLHVESHGRNMRISIISHALVWEVLMLFRSRRTRASNLVSRFSRFVIYIYLFTYECSRIFSYGGVMCLCGCFHGLQKVS